MSQFVPQRILYEKLYMSQFSVGAGLVFIAFPMISFILHILFQMRSDWVWWYFVLFL